VLELSIKGARFALGFALREGVKDEVEEDEEQDEFGHKAKLLGVTDRFLSL
jgi:hypothetical protein